MKQHKQFSHNGFFDIKTTAKMSTSNRYPMFMDTESKRIANNAKADTSSKEWVLAEDRPKRAKPSSQKERLLQSIEQGKYEIETMEKHLKLMDTLSFKQGDAVFHKEFGNVIIREIYIPGPYKQNPHGDELSAVVTTVDTELEVKYKDLLPISEATKILFEKKNE